jgi:hypothetical protein
MTSDFSNYPPSIGGPRKKKNKAKQGHRFLKESLHLPAAGFKPIQ